MDSPAVLAAGALSRYAAAPAPNDLARSVPCCPAPLRSAGAPPRAALDDDDDDGQDRE